MPFDIELPVSRRNHYIAPRCGLCGLKRKCKSPLMPVDGLGKRKILICGESPGETEDERGKPFVGVSGQFLEKCLLEVGIRMRTDCWLTNSIICHPPRNETPTSEQISYCYPNLAKTLRQLNPNTIICLGRSSVESVTSGIWLEDIGNMERWVGWNIPCRELNSWICPTYHPSFVLREMSRTKGNCPARTLFLQHLAKATQFESKPYDQLPQDKIKIILDPEEAAHYILRFLSSGGPIAFDYETDCLKPEQGGELVSVSVCWRGKTTIAFPWTGISVRKAWYRLMKSDCPKIAHNIKFEDRWTRRQERVWQETEDHGTYRAPRPFYMKVQGWVHDTMVTAHILDPRKAVCSLGFLAFVHLGVGTYGTDVVPYLAAGSQGKNQIRKAPLKKLLEYNALDSLYTYQIAQLQRKLLHLPPL